MNAKTLFLAATTCLLILIVACSKSPEDDEHVQIEKPLSHSETLPIEDAHVHPSTETEIDVESTDTIDLPAAVEKSTAFQQSLDASLDIGTALLTASELTDEQIEAFIQSFNNPWDADTILWNEYMSTQDTNKLAVAARIFRYLIDNYDDPKTQAYARDHLGRVLQRKGKYAKALDMFESVELQPDGQDFWYSGARANAGTVAYVMLDHVKDLDEMKKLVKRGQDNLDAALEVNQHLSVRAGIFTMKGDFYMNYNYQKAYDAFKKAYELRIADGDDYGANLVRPWIDAARKNLDRSGSENFGFFRESP